MLSGRRALEVMVISTPRHAVHTHPRELRPLWGPKLRKPPASPGPADTPDLTPIPGVPITADRWPLPPSPWLLPAGEALWGPLLESGPWPLPSNKGSGKHHPLPPPMLLSPTSRHTSCALNSYAQGRPTIPACSLPLGSGLRLTPQSLGTLSTQHPVPTAPCTHCSSLEEP